MTKSLWDNATAKQLISDYGSHGICEDLALRVYTSRLLGSNPKLVTHGGGNTSVKTTLPNLVGDLESVLCVKGSGWDLSTIEPEGLPAVRIEPLHKVREREQLSDEEMVRLQRANLLDPGSPNPSVETLLHAFLPHKFIDHTHATAILSISNQADGKERCKDLFGDRIAIVPYVMPGFGLAKATAEIYEANPDVEGIILHQHGIFTFGDSARQSYERMIDLVTLAEKFISENRSRATRSAALPKKLASREEIAPIIRGLCAEELDGRQHRRWIVDFRDSATVMDFVNGEGLPDYGIRGVITPDHIIRTKNRPLILPAPKADSLDEFISAAREAIASYKMRYEEYFRANNAKQEIPKTQLDPVPRIVLVPGVGMFTLGKTLTDAAVAADLAELMMETVADAESIGRFLALPDSDLFDMEYWSLEQAKLGKGSELPLQRQVAFITGAGGTIGIAVAELFAKNGCSVVMFDRDASTVEPAADNIGPNAIAVVGDVTNENDVRAALDQAARKFGGVDILVSNAGAAWQGEIDELDDAVLRKSFELNFFAHQSVAKNAVRIMRKQGTGGCLLFNASKQAVNPGAGFGAYGLPKAATLFLSRQYALDCGKYGIRSNAVNADRIRSGLLTAEMVDARADARGVSAETYLAGNLLEAEVEARHVAEAFLQLALAERTTASVATVDGGNIAAALR